MARDPVADEIRGCERGISDLETRIRKCRRDIRKQESYRGYMPQRSHNPDAARAGYDKEIARLKTLISRYEDNIKDHRKRISRLQQQKKR